MRNVSEAMEDYSVIISSQPTDDGKIEWKASVEWNGQQIKESPWSGITDAHLASLTFLNGIYNKLMEEENKPPEVDTSTSCSHCDGEGTSVTGDMCYTCDGSGHARIARRSRPMRLT